MIHIFLFFVLGLKDRIMLYNPFTFFWEGEFAHPSQTGWCQLPSRKPRLNALVCMLLRSGRFGCIYFLVISASTLGHVVSTSALRGETFTPINQGFSLRSKRQSLSPCHFRKYIFEPANGGSCPKCLKLRGTPKGGAILSPEGIEGPMPSTLSPTSRNGRSIK